MKDIMKNYVHRTKMRSESIKEKEVRQTRKGLGVAGAMRNE